MPKLSAWSNSGIASDASGTTSVSAATPTTTRLPGIGSFARS